VPQNVNTHTSDEIDLHEFFHVLWKSRRLIAVTTLVVACLATAYAFLSAPIYQTSVHILPPSAGGLASYNVASQLTGDAIRGTVPDSASGIAPLTTAEAYETFLRHLNSNSIRQHFFVKYYLPAQKDNQTEGDKQRAWKRLNDELIIKLPRSADEIESSLTLEGNDPGTTAKWANTYVSLATRAATQELLNGLAGEVKIRRLSLEDQINTIREAAELIRQDRIVRLQEALTIAESIGLKTPADAAPFNAINTHGLSTESVISSSLLYLRGSNALKAELQQLGQRTSDDPYIVELPNLLKKQALLDNINLNPELMSVATIDRAAIVPDEPIKPRKVLIVALGLILGCLLGILGALFRHFYRRY